MFPLQTFSETAHMASAPQAGGLRPDPRPDLHRAAQQFEALFMQMMLKNMRNASFGGGLLDNDSSQFYQQMLDQRMVDQFSSQQSLGIADMIVKQLTPLLGQSGMELAEKTDGSKSAMQQPTHGTASIAQAPLPDLNRRPAQAVMQTAPATTAPVFHTQNTKHVFAGPADFVEKLLPYARAAASLLGLPPRALLAQAALETGWGQHLPQGSFNVFGIKADTGWDGAAAGARTLEQDAGQVVSTPAEFRAYRSYKDSFFDYIRFLKTNPRYRSALEQVRQPAQYFAALQRAGYATDTNYAAKILNIMHGPTMHEALSQLKDKPI